MRLMLVLCMLFSWLAAPVSEAAIVVTGNSVAATLAGRLVLTPSVPPLAPPLVGGNVTVAALPVPVATTLINQSGLVTTVNFGIVNGVALTMPNQGIMLTNGNIFGTGNVLTPVTPGDVDVQVAIPGAFAGTTHDAASLTFSFTTPAGLNYISLNAIFATNELIGSTAIKDAAVIIVDGVNQGKFANGDPLSNLNTNSISVAPGIITGFANVSTLQTIVAPLNTALAVHTIKIAIADHADSSRDSAILLSSMKAIAAPPLAGGAGPVATGVTVVQGNAPGVAPAAGSADPIPPRLRLIGSAQIDLMQGNAFTDPGAIAFDNIDGNLTAGITVTNPVLTGTPGTYTVTYSVSDLTANTTTLTRTVIVHAPTAADVLPPVVTPPADVMLTATDSRGVLITDARLAGFFASVIAVDNLGVLGAITNDAPLPPLYVPVGKTVVTFSAKDAALNTGTAKATITVIGTTRTKPGIDLDLDGIPDSWELAVFNSLLAATAISDADLDGLSDLLEWQLGTNPLLPNTNTLSVSTDSWSVIYSNNPSDSDSDGVIDALENASSVLNPAIVTGLPVGIGSAVTYSIDAGAGNQLKSVHTNVPGAGAPLNIVPGFGVLSFRIKTATVGGTATVRITSSSPFGSAAQFYKVNHAGVYTLIPLANVNIVASNIVDLTLTDGGPLDLGGPVADGWIIDPIAIGSAPLILGGSGPSGGCSITQANGVDPLLPVLVLFALFYLIRSRKTSLRI